MKRAAYRCCHCGGLHEDGRRNPCEDRGQQAARYPVWREGEVEMFPGHVHAVKIDTTMVQVEDLGRRWAPVRCTPG
jgi:hypothetical protein